MFRPWIDKFGDFHAFSPVQFFIPVKMEKNFGLIGSDKSFRNFTWDFLSPDHDFVV